MTAVLRVFTTLICSVATYYFVYWVPFSLIMPNRTAELVPFIGSAACAVLVGSYVWRGLASVPSGLVSSIVMGGALVGGVSFVAGFFGPIILAPEANQGPLLGLFITGPLGAVVGAVGGFAVWLARRRRAERTPHEGGGRPTSGCS
jgi:hypothetical protein